MSTDSTTTHPATPTHSVPVTAALSSHHHAAPLIGSPFPGQAGNTPPPASTGDDHENSSKAKLELKELVEKAKKTDAKLGLSSTEVLNRQREFGKNELPEKKISPLMQFLAYLWGPMPIMIWVAIIIELVKSIAVGEGWVDFVVSIRI